MPVTIACPKCQKKYRLSGDVLGKTVKCKACQTSFRTRASEPATSPENRSKSSGTPVPKANQPSAAELAEFGLAGSLQRQADPFDGTPDPRSTRGLGNFAAEDPGFSAPSAKAKPSSDPKASVAEPANVDDLQAVLANPVLRESASRLKQAKSTSKSDNAYFLPRIGMRVFSTCLMLMLAIIATAIILRTIQYLAPGWREMVGETVATVIRMAFSVLLGSFALSLLLAIVAQVLCIFSPNEDEKLFASLTVGSQVAAILIPAIGLLSAVTFGSGSVQVTGAVLLVASVLIGYACALATTVLFTMYFRKIGRNVRSRELVDAAKNAMTTWIAVLILSVVNTIVLMVCVNTYGAPSPGKPPNETLQFIGQVGGFVYLAGGVAVLVMMLLMINKAIERTAGK